MESLTDRFLRYISYNTASNENSETVPSTKGQLEFSKILAEECLKMGLEVNSKKGYIYARLKANAQGYPKIGFIAHMDTSPEARGENIKPRIIKNYSGEDIKFDNGKIMSPADFPELKDYVGQDIITTDGTTLLGADDKAGIAEIMTAVEEIKNSTINHGDIIIGFTPDEEIGRGADAFDVNVFGADFAYTMDGGAIGELEFENFNAAKAKIKISGRNVHPGYAKNKMLNAVLIGSKIAEALPSGETPAKTSGYEGFYHLCSLKGDVEECEMTYIIRDFFSDSFEKRKNLLADTVKRLNKKYGGVIDLQIYDEYKNMREKLEDKMYVVSLAEKSMRDCGIEPIIQPIRGGTDGARLSFMGLPCPNIFAGGHNFHGIYEFIPINSMEKAVELIIKICQNSYGIKV